MTMEVMEWQRLRAERQEKSKPWYSEQAVGVSLHINAWGFEGRISWNRLALVVRTLRNSDSKDSREAWKLV